MVPAMVVTKAGMVAVIGRPNAGKSTLVNKLIGEKVSIVTDKPQTTRHRICAVLNENGVQAVLMDTPGFHKPRTRLGEYMSKVVRESVSGTDAAVLVVEPIASVGDIEKDLISQLAGMKCPAILAVNKIDKVDKAGLLEVIATYSREYGFKAVIPVSALEGDGVDILKGELLPLMPEGPALFPEDVVTDQPDKLLISEIIREKILELMRDEIPHGTAVAVEKLSERPDGLVDIEAVIFCERDSHKGMLIGKKGAMLKSIGAAARAELEEMYEGKVNLQTWVKVSKNWRDKPSALGQLGYR